MNATGLPWWKKTVVYQIYPRSFRDSNGDGIGDLRGVVERLDYLKELGVETLWLSPFFRSPQKDFGYDISDYASVAQEYGTSEDCALLFEETHRRGMKIVLDLVLNHTSDEHPWFVEARSSRDNPKRDWYVWRDGRRPDGKEPPNNWRSKVSGSGWHYDGKSGQWYWAAFLPFQPDLNYRNPEVRKAMFGVVRHWLAKGADGFRLDIIGSLFEDAAFRDNPAAPNLLPTEENGGMLFRSARMTENLDETFAFVRELRAVVDEFDDPPRFLVGETFGGLGTLRRYCGAERSDGLHTVFLFQTLAAPFRASAFRRLVRDAERFFPEPFLPTWVFSNHDVMRRVSVLGNDAFKAALCAFLQFTLRGVPYVYYGEELGLPQTDFPFRTALDPIAALFARLPVFVQRLLQKLMLGRVNRDGCRTPMAWTRAPNAGFCAAGAKPWLPLHANHERVNVEAQQGVAGSLLETYRALLRLRREHEALRAGTLELAPDGLFPSTVLAFRRRVEGGEELAVLANMGGRELRVRLDPAWRGRGLYSLISIERMTDSDGERTLEPWDAIVIQTNARQT